MNSTHYIHDLDPVLLPVWGNLAVRWYGLSYVAGFVVAYLLLNRWGRQGRFALHGEALQSFLVTIVVGVMVGGRLGYVLFYDFDQFLADPLVLFRLWEGGMASHGGMIGLALAAWYSARRLRIPFLHLTDGLACAAPIGLCFGRLANFINGELWGRISTVPWAVIFPQEAGLFHGDDPAGEQTRDLIARGILSPRHPSQLYQAALEGLALFVILLLVRRTAWGRVNGRCSAVFLLGYALFRFTAEFFREPEITHFGWLSQGQLLSLIILLPTAAVLLYRSAASTNQESHR
ncbi:MAG TPA: prolipoprotein diacylglyceryl transferase [Kiritimatiellia bacterium]|nr:prolipoprotein diacylglyceryl transferase [Kiritimatiellia bacterium]HMP34518.1 prolipoprotein diacylglyceryl transferase [Kiritimatiellia bacterium]